jgi:hypothetical protein
MRTCGVILAAVLIAMAPVSCGSTDAPEDGVAAVSPPVEVALFCAPPAKVTVDGAPAGTTPSFVCLSRGTHELTFARESFRVETRRLEVVADTAISVEVELAVEDVDREAALAELARVLETDREPLDAGPVAPRSGTGTAVTLVWPREDVRLSELTTYRIDVDESYEGDGSLVFREGGAVISSEAFRPAGPVTVGTIPAAVTESLRTDGEVEWGLTFPGDERRDVLTGFRAVQRPEVARRAEGLEEEGLFRIQPLLVQHLLLADALRTAGLSSEALQRYLAVAEVWPDSALALEGVVTSARRLGLEGSDLYAAARAAAEDPGDGLPAPLAGGPGLAVLLRESGPAVPVPAPEAGPASEVASVPRAPGTGVPTDRAALLSELRQTASDLEELSRRVKGEAEALSEAAGGVREAEVELEGELQRAEADLASDVEAARERLAERRERIGGITSEAAQASVSAGIRRAAALSKAASAVGKAEENVAEGEGLADPLSAAADALEALADVLGAEARDLETAARDSERARPALEGAEVSLVAAEKEFADAQASLRAAEDSLDAGRGEEAEAAREAMTMAHEALEKSRTDLQASEKRLREVRAEIKDALVTSGGRDPAAARKVAGTDREREAELRKLASRFRAAGRMGRGPR